MRTFKKLLEEAEKLILPKVIKFIQNDKVPDALVLKLIPEVYDDLPESNTGEDYTVEDILELFKSNTLVFKLWRRKPVKLVR